MNKYTTFQQVLECKYKDAIELKNSFITQNKPFFSYENDEIFLGQCTNSLGYEIDDLYLSETKLALKPLSNNEVQKHGYDNLEDADYNIKNGHVNYSIMQDMLSEHLDVFYLIEKGGAIDIDTIPK